jgi:hypothetical protein
MWAQATVNESLETAFLYVDAAKGSDSNPGTQSQPFRTISAATSTAETNNHHGTGTKIIINPGTYRETITLMGNQYYTAMPITFQANGSGVVVSGAVRNQNWQPYASNPAIYTTSWTHNWGLCAPELSGNGPREADIVLRREMIFVDGVLLTQVLKVGQMREGTFFVDETNNLAYIWPAAGTDISTADVEVATLPELFHLVSVSHVVVRGITFKYANSCRDNTAVYVAGSATNILFDSDNFLWNNSVGLHFFTPVSNITVQNAVSSHNGQAGMMAVSVKYGLWRSVTTSFNNWRGAQGSYYNWSSAGIHFFSDHDVTVSGLVTAYNQTHGVHWDTDNANVTVSNMLATGNLADGAVVEKSEGPVAVSNSHFCRNNQGVKNSYLYQGGFVLRNSEHVSLTNSVLYNNQITQIDVIGQRGGIEGSNWETGQTYNLKTQNFTHTGNVIQAVGTQNTLTDSYLNGADWTAFQTTLNSNKNVWWNSSNHTVFEVPVSTMHPLSGWQSVTSQDGLSNWNQPADPTSACAVASDPDYWFLVDDSSKTVAEDGTAMFALSLIPFGGLTGTATLHFDGIREVPGLNATMTSGTQPLTGGASQLLVTAAVTTAPGTYPITFYANSGSVTRSVTSFLIVPETSVRLSSLALDFGRVKAKTASPVHSITITNFGKKALSLAGMVFSGAKDYTETSNCGAVLTAGETCTVNVTFTPKVAGPRNGTLTISDGDLTGPQIVTLTGSGS